MRQCFFENTILDRLPISLSGITHVDFSFAPGVCPKLNNQKSSKQTLPIS